MSKMIKHIAIVGSGLPVHMATALLANALRAFNIQLSVVVLPCSTQSSTIESCGPEFSALCAILGIDERVAMRQTQATFSLGSHYLSNQGNWFVPFAHLGFNPEQDDFEQGLFQYLRTAPQSNLDAWSIASSAALAGKFAIAGKDRPDLRQALDYGVQLDRQGYQQLIKNYLQQFSNIQWNHLSAAQIHTQRSASGDIERVMADGQDIVADFWLDISQDALLSSDTSRLNTDILELASQRCEWSTSQVELDKPYSSMQKTDKGWLKTLRLRDKTLHQFLLTEAQVDVAQVEQQLRDMPLGFTHAQWQKNLWFVNRQPWQNNCLSLGNASLQLGELVFSELQLVQAALVQFIDLFPDLPIGEHNRQHYNRVWQRFVQDAQDYTCAHLDSAAPDCLPDHMENMPLSLVQRIEVFARLGRLVPMQSDAVTESQWYHLLFGLGYRPQLSSVVLSAFGPQDLQQAVDKVRHSITRLVAGMPDHQHYLARFYPLASNQK